MFKEFKIRSFQANPNPLLRMSILSLLLLVVRSQTCIGIDDHNTGLFYPNPGSKCVGPQVGGVAIPVAKPPPQALFCWPDCGAKLHSFYTQGGPQMNVNEKQCVFEIEGGKKVLACQSSSGFHLGNVNHVTVGAIPKPPANPNIQSLSDQVITSFPNQFLLSVFICGNLESMNKDARIAYRNLILNSNNVGQLVSDLKDLSNVQLSAITKPWVSALSVLTSLVPHISTILGHVVSSANGVQIVANMGTPEAQRFTSSLIQVVLSNKFTLAQIKSSFNMILVHNGQPSNYVKFMSWIREQIGMSSHVHTSDEWILDYIKIRHLM